MGDMVILKPYKKLNREKLLNIMYDTVKQIRDGNEEVLNKHSMLLREIKDRNIVLTEEELINQITFLGRCSSWKRRI